MTVPFNPAGSPSIRKYPKGFVIGTIDVVAGGVGEYHEINVRPAVDFARLEEVLIVRTPPPSRGASEGVQ